MTDLLSLDTWRGFFAAAPFMVDLGVQPTAVSEGRMSTELVVAPRHLQHTGIVHAGVMATLADHTMGAAAQTLAREGQWVLTAELKTSLLRGVAAERLHCQAWVLKGGRTLSFTEAEVWAEVDGGRVLVMKASATMAVTTAR